LAFVLAGWLVVRLGEQALILANLSCFVIGACLALQIKTTKQLTTDALPFSSPTWWDSFFEGIAYLRQHQLARTIITLEFIEYWPHAMWTSAITLTFVRQALHTTPEVWGVQNALYYSGQLLGAACALVFANRLARQPGWVIVVDIAVTTVLNFCYAVSPNVPFALLVCFAFGPPASMRDVAQNALLQASVHGAMLGRVYATRQMLLNIITMLAGTGLAWLADHYPVRWLFLGGTLFYAMAFVYAWSHLAIRKAQLQTDVLLSPAD
jgi:MFS family permease